MSLVPEFNNSASGPIDTREAEAFLKKMGVPFVKLDDGRLDVRGNLDISHKGLKRLPDLSNVIVRWDFDCSYNPLEDLRGAPAYIGKNCRVNNCGLTTLGGTLHTIGEDFNCANNQLPDFIGGPKKIKNSIHATYNLFTTFAGLPSDFDGLLLSDLGTFRSGQIPSHLKKTPQVRKIAPAPAAPVVPPLPSRNSLMTDQDEYGTVPTPKAHEAKAVAVPGEKSSPADKVMFVENFQGVQMCRLYDFSRMERLVFARQDKDSPMQGSPDCDPFSTLQQDPLLKKAYEVHVQRGGTVSYEDIFGQRRTLKFVDRPPTGPK